MRGFSRALVALLCAIAICLPPMGARADFSPRLSALTPEEGITAELCGTFETLSPLSEESLAIVNDWLSRIRITLSLQESAARSQRRAEVAMDGKALFSVSSLAQSAYTLTAFSPSGSAYLTDPGAPDALSLLGGEGDGLADLSRLPDAYAAWAPALYPLLAGLTPPKQAKVSTSIKNAAASAAYENYIFTGEEMNAAWPQILDTLLPPLKALLAEQPGRYAQIKALLSGLTFSGECRFKRFLNQSGGDMGLQFTGRAGRGEDVRKVTLFGGYTPGKGGYFSLALPAVSGKNNFKIMLTGKLSEKAAQRTLSLEGGYTRTWEGNTQTARLEASLKNAIKNEDEAWSGKITLESKRDGVKTAWTLTPDLAFTDAGLQGQIDIRRKTDGDQTLRALLSLTMKKADALPAPEATAAKDLRGMAEENARAVVAGESVGLVRVLYQLLNALPEESRSVLTHELRTEDWMNAPSPPVTEEAAPPAPENGSWIVEEEENQ